MIIEGSAAPGFEKLREVLGLRSDLEPGGGAFAAYIDGRLVADLWAGQSAPGRPWEQDTLAVLMSSTKGLVTLCAQILVDRGVLDVDVPVATYWPEFAQNGKQGVLVRHVLTHTSGVLGFPGQSALLGWDGTGWDRHDLIADGLAASTPAWEPGQQQGYHALTFGWLLGELVRRLTGSSVGAFFRAEVAEPLGLDMWIGTPISEQARVAQVVGLSADRLPRPVRPVYNRMQRPLRSTTTLNGQAYLGDGTFSIIDQIGPLLGASAVLEAEVPAANGTATARSLAKVYAMLSLHGELDGVRLLSPAGVDRFATTVVRSPDVLMAEMALPGMKRLMSIPAERTLGYLVNPRVLGQARRFGPVRSAFGHDGAGGQIAFCDLENRVSVGFVRNALTTSPKLSVKLINVLYDCAGLA